MSKYKKLTVSEICEAIIAEADGTLIDDARVAMMQSGEFYAIRRTGLQPALWRKSKRGVCPVKPEWLRDWLRSRLRVAVSASFAKRVLSADLTSFASVTPDTAGLI